MHPNFINNGKSAKRFIASQPETFHFTKVLRLQFEATDLTGGDRPWLEERIPDLKYVWLRRKDVVGAAVSRAFAEATDVWSYQQANIHPGQYANLNVVVDDDTLLKWYDYYTERFDCWEGFLEGASSLRIYYEDLVSIPEDTFRSAMLYLGVEPDVVTNAMSKCKQKKMINPQKELLAERLRSLIKDGSPRHICDA